MKKLIDYFFKNDSKKVPQNVTKTDIKKSTIVFEVDTIDGELSVKVVSEFNEDIINTLIDKGYLRPEESEDEYVIHLAFILLANETTENIIEGINNRYDEN